MSDSYTFIQSPLMFRAENDRDFLLPFPSSFLFPIPGGGSHYQLVTPHQLGVRAGLEAKHGGAALWA
jgi:hypothetical protein